MKLTLITSIIGLILIFIYVLLINLIAIDVYNQPTGTEKKETAESGGESMVQISLSEQVDVSVERHRWYGTIYEYHSKEKSIGILRLFGFLKLPTMVNGKELWGFHLIALGVYLIAIIMSITINLLFPEERRDENGNALGN